jgi:hypothetical protein
MQGEVVLRSAEDLEVEDDVSTLFSELIRLLPFLSRLAADRFAERLLKIMDFLFLGFLEGSTTAGSTGSGAGESGDFLSNCSTV